MDPSEHDMFRAAIHGDRDAFEMIIRNSSRTLFAIAYAILQNRAEAEDAVQDALVRAWKSRWRVRDPEKFPAWLATIVRHRAHDLLRRSKRVELKSDIGEDTDSGFALDATASETHALDQQVNAALATLPETHRTALTLRYLDDLDYRAIESIMGLSNGAVRGILGRALGAMRKRLAPALATLE
jgi:RNA polymerase sigma-70 factor (ECF subfamily)